jgi:hypothetical protein
MYERLISAYLRGGGSRSSDLVTLQIGFMLLLRQSNTSLYGRHLSLFLKHEAQRKIAQIEESLKICKFLLIFIFIG